MLFKYTQSSSVAQVSHIAQLASATSLAQIPKFFAKFMGKKGRCAGLSSGTGCPYHISVPWFYSVFDLTWLGMG